LYRTGSSDEEHGLRVVDPAFPGDFTRFDAVDNGDGPGLVRKTVGVVDTDSDLFLEF
jgi:hypothetical protein